MSRRFPLWGALLGVLLLVGCQSYKSVPFERSAEIRRIGLPTPAAPDRPEAMLASSVGQSFGLVGALIDAGMASERASSLDRILAAEGFEAQEEMSRALVAALEARGYEVVLLEAERAPEPGYLEAYPKASPPVDAYLDVVVEAYGFAAAGIHASTPYRPYVYTANRLVAPGGRVLMEDHVVYNHIERGGLVETQQVTVAPEAGYQYATFDGLTANAGVAVEGLDKAFDKTAETIGTLLQ